MTDDPVFLLSDRGPLVLTCFGVGEAHRDSYEAMGAPLPEPVRVVGLIDTGADLCVVKQGTFRALGVTPTIRRFVTTMGQHRQERFAYLGAFTFGTAGEVPATVIEDLPPGARVDCILGREVLRFGKLVYDGQHGTVELFVYGKPVKVSPRSEDL